MNVNKNSRVKQKHNKTNTFSNGRLYRGDTIVFATATTTVSPLHPLFLIARLGNRKQGRDTSK